MRKLTSLINTAVVVGMIAVASYAQQVSRPAGPNKSACDWDSDRNYLLITREESFALSTNTELKFTPAGAKPKPLRCALFTLAKARSDRAASALELGTVRRPSAAESSQDQGQPAAADEAQELAKKLSNPVASLISFPMQSNFDFGMGTGSGWRYTLNVQPVIPMKLNENWNVISRTIVPIIHQGNVTGPNTSQSGLGDTVQSFFFSPRKSEPFVWAVGPVILLPTATNASLGGQKWGLGPTALVLKQQQGWTYGVLANHIWSVAGKSNRSEVNSTFLQPFLSFTNKQAWTYGVNTESTYDWNSGSWSLPINFSVSKLVRFGKQPVSFGGGPKCWVTTPTGGPEGCAIRIVVTALFPKK